MLQHVMLDLETMGTRPGSSILSLGAVLVDLAGNTGDSFYSTISHASCIDAGLTVDEQTRAWWSQQSADARAAVLRDPKPLDCVAAEFSSWLRSSSAIYVWSQGANFDPVLWEAASVAVKRSAPWKFFNVRDTRTLYHIAGFNPKGMPRAGTYHNALDDAFHQVKCVAAAVAALKQQVAA